MRWLALSVFLALPLHAQVVEINGGSSSLYQSSGAAVIFHLPNSTAYASAGVSGGRVHFGFADSRQWRGWDVTLGDKAFSGTAGGAGLGIVVRGVSATRGGLTLFAGGTGPSYAAPYFSAATMQHFGAGLSYRHKFSHGLDFNSLEVLDGGKRTAVESLGYHWRVLRLTGTGGMLESARYWNASLDLQPARWAAFSGAHTKYSFATVDSAGASMRLGPLNFHASTFASGHVSGQAVGAGARIGFVDLRADIFRSHFGSNVSGAIGERLGRRWRVDQFISESTGRWSLSFGGGYTSNRLAVSVGYQTYFMPTWAGRQPFQRALAVQISFRLPHDSAVTLATNVDPTGKLRYAAYGSTFAYTNWLPNDEPRQRPAVRGGFILRGIVSEKSGMPVVGAAVSVGGQLAYTDSTGAFFVREKKPMPQPVRVAMDDFAAPGRWLVVDCPGTATPDVPLKITIERAR